MVNVDVDSLKKAIEFENNGRKLEALKLYSIGIDELSIKAKTAPRSDKSRLQAKIVEYTDKAKRLKEEIDNWESEGKIREKIPIADGSTGYSYETVFSKYMDPAVIEVAIQEPYLKKIFQLNNLVMFCELLVLKCVNLKYIRVVTSENHRDENQENAFQALQKSLQDRNIQISYEYINNCHERHIILSNGFVIRNDRGLDYFKGQQNKFALGSFNYNLRECRLTNILIYYCPKILMKQKSSLNVSRVFLWFCCK